MPNITSSYRAPLFLRNGHANTIFPSLFRRLKPVMSRREMIDTLDHDFLCLDWYETGSRRLVIVSHGLEGHSERPYVLGMVRHMNKLGWDALAWNFRSCGPKMNRQKRFYHSGATDDLAHVVAHASEQGYQEIALVGFSMGGNLTLLHAGREAAELNDKVVGAVGVSVPCDLEGCANQLAQPNNRIYMKRFLRDLYGKMQAKQETFPEDISVEHYAEIRDFRQFDDAYTAPLHGFKDATDYWTQSSCLSYLKDISIPALLINAKDDPFLSESAYPYQQADDSSHLYLETPGNGGHVGFVSFNSDGSYWIDQRVGEFLSGLVG